MVKFKMSITVCTVLFLCLHNVAVSTTINGRSKLVCPLWHVKQMGKCKCVANLKGHIECHKDTLSVYNMCLTWDNKTDSLHAGYCLFIPIDYAICKTNRYRVSTNLTGPGLNKQICGRLNRQGAQCKQCISGYGPAALSDGVSCADCSKHRHMWILTLLLQLFCLTIMFMIIMVLQIKGTASPWNIIITYSQLAANALMYSVHLPHLIECYVGKKVMILTITILGISNLDFFRLIIPPLCISSSLKPIQTLFFDYITALYPIFITMFMYALIELYDRNCRAVVILSTPLRKIYGYLQGRCDPKQSILSTFATFLLLSYSKLLFVSSNFLFAIQLYNSTGDLVPNSTVLLYDPSIPFFHSQHTPYITVALSAITIFILLPPLLLLLYPTRLFKRLLTCCRFQRWDILHMIMDTFQGWYKDGTEGTYDYRPLSALYMILRVSFVGEYLIIIDIGRYGRADLKAFVFGLLQIIPGTFFFIAKPYKKQWMNVIDGFILTLVGLYCIITKV